MLKNTKTAQHYSYQWSKDFNYHEALKDEKIARTSIGGAAFMDSHFDEFAKNTSSVLDVACGFGRIADEFNKRNYKGTYVGLDINDTMRDIKQERYADKPNYLFHRANMEDNIFMPESFDLVICRAAIMYAADPEKTFSRIGHAGKPGGTYFISAYTKKAPIRELADDYYREYFSHLSNEEAFEALQEFSLFGKLLQDLNVKINIPYDFEFLGIKQGEYELQRLIYYNFLKCFYNEHYGMKYSTLVNFDWYHPEYSHRFTKEEIEQWFFNENIEITAYHHMPAHHFFIGVKP